MSFNTRNLTKDAAIAAARAAAVISKRSHIVVQLRNGRYRWARLGFFVNLLVEQTARKIWYVSTRGDVVATKE